MHYGGLPALDVSAVARLGGAGAASAGAAALCWRLWALCGQSHNEALLLNSWNPTIFK